MGFEIAQLEDLSRSARVLTGMILDAERQLRQMAVSGLADGVQGQDVLPDLNLLGKVHCRWRLAVNSTTKQRFLVWRSTDHRSVLRLHLDATLAPTPLGSGPTVPPAAATVGLERPSLLRPVSVAELARLPPNKRINAHNTVLLDLGDLGILAVRRPDFLLGFFPRAKLWLAGEQLEPTSGRWPATPFLELIRRVSAWLAGDEVVTMVPLAGEPDDVLRQVVAEIVQARRVLQEKLVEAALGRRTADERLPSPLGALQAEYVIQDMRADLALRLDTAGDLTDEENDSAVVLGLRLFFEEAPSSPPTAQPVARLQLQAPEFLASGEVLRSLLAALRDDLGQWRDDLDVDLLRRALGVAEQRRTLALRIGRKAKRERWVLFLPTDRHRRVLWAVRADFKRLPPSEAHDGVRLPGAVLGNRRLLHDPTQHDNRGHFDDDMVRAFLRLITALWRYGQALF